MTRWIVSIVALSLLIVSTASAHPHATPSPSATPSPAPSDSPTPGDTPSPSPAPTKAAPLPVDGAYSLPGGIWNCETLGNSTAVSVYKMTTAHTMIEKTTLRLPNRPPVELDTTFVFNPKQMRWGLSMQKGAYVATAPTWSDAVWTFEGTESDADPKRTVRLVYTSLGPDAYRSDYQAMGKSGTWQTFSGATCKRVIP